MYRGGIHPNPGEGVKIQLSDSSFANCTMENIEGGTKSCPTNWYGRADENFCFKVDLRQVTNNEAVR